MADSSSGVWSAECGFESRSWHLLGKIGEVVLSALPARLRTDDTQAYIRMDCKRGNPVSDLGVGSNGLWKNNNCSPHLTNHLNPAWMWTTVQSVILFHVQLGVLHLQSQLCISQILCSNHFQSFHGQYCSPVNLQLDSNLSQMHFWACSLAISIEHSIQCFCDYQKCHLPTCVRHQCQSSHRQMGCLLKTCGWIWTSAKKCISLAILIEHSIQCFCETSVSIIPQYGMPEKWQSKVVQKIRVYLKSGFNRVRSPTLQHQQW